MVKEAVIYCRVSTNLQIGDNHVTMELQEKRGHEFAARTGYTVIKTCSDAGISGKSRKNRKGLTEALSLLKKDDALIVFNLSRLARNTRETLEIFEEIQKKKAHLLSVTENINSADAVGRLWITLLSSLAQFERETTAERVSKAMEYKKQKGERVGRIPFGYQLSNGKGSLLVENPEEQRIIRLIFEKRASLDDRGKPKSYRKIADELNAEKVPAGKTAKQWYPTSCERILKRKPIVIASPIAEDNPEDEEPEVNEDDIRRLLASTLANFDQDNEEHENENNEDNEEEDENNEDNEEEYENIQGEDENNEEIPEDLEIDQHLEKDNEDNEENEDDEVFDQDNEDIPDQDNNDLPLPEEEDLNIEDTQGQTFDLTQTINLLQRAINEKWPQEQIDAIRSLLAPVPAPGLAPKTAPKTTETMIKVPNTQKVTKPNIRKEAPLVVAKSPTPHLIPNVPKMTKKAVAKNTSPVPEALPNPLPKPLPKEIPKEIPKPTSTKVVPKPAPKAIQKASPVPKTVETKLIQNKPTAKASTNIISPAVQKNPMPKVETRTAIPKNVPKRVPK